MREGFPQKPLDVQKAIYTGDTTLLSSLGKKGAQRKEESAVARDLYAEEAAQEVVQELQDAHLITEDGTHAISGEAIDVAAYKKSIIAMRKRMAALEKK